MTRSLTTRLATLAIVAVAWLTAVVPAFAASSPSVDAGRFAGWEGGLPAPGALAAGTVVLAVDDTFAPLPLGSGTGAGDAGTFVVVGRQVLVPRLDHGAVGLWALALDGTRARPLPGYVPLRPSLAPIDGGAGFWDRERAALVVLDAELEERESVPTGLTVVVSFGRFADGSLLASSLNMHGLPESTTAALRARTGLGDEEILARLACCKEGAVFLLDPGFEPISTPVRRTGPPDPGDRAAGARDRHQIRLSPEGDLAAVFSPHLEGIGLVDARGEVVGVLRHPGDGRPVAAGEPLATVLSPGQQAFFQSDLALTGDRLLVADPVSRSVWVHTLGEVAWHRAEVEVPIVRLQVASGRLYGLGDDGVLRRFLLPE